MKDYTKQNYMEMDLYNKTIPRLEKAFILIEDGDVILLEYGKAIVIDGNIERRVNYTRETCTCAEHTNNGELKCTHVWAAQLKQRQVLERIN